MFSTAVSCGHNLRCSFTCEGNLLPRARVTLIQRNGQRPLDKGSAGSGNEIAVRCEECEGTFTNKLSFRWIRVNADSVNETDGEVYTSLRGRRNRGGAGEREKVREAPITPATQAMFRQSGFLWQCLGNVKNIS